MKLERTRGHREGLCSAFLDEVEAVRQTSGTMCGSGMRAGLDWCSFSLSSSPRSK